MVHSLSVETCCSYV